MYHGKAPRVRSHRPVHSSAPADSRVTRAACPQSPSAQRQPPVQEFNLNSSRKPTRLGSLARLGQEATLALCWLVRGSQGARFRLGRCSERCGGGSGVGPSLYISLTHVHFSVCIINLGPWHMYTTI